MCAFSLQLYKMDKDTKDTPMGEDVARNKKVGVRIGPFTCDA